MREDLKHDEVKMFIELHIWMMKGTNWMRNLMKSDWIWDKNEKLSSLEWDFNTRRRKWCFMTNIEMF